MEADDDDGDDGGANARLHGNAMALAAVIAAPCRCVDARAIVHAKARPSDDDMVVVATLAMCAGRSIWIALCWGDEGEGLGS